MSKPNKPKGQRGRPTTREIKLGASPERVARAMFAAAKTPDPMRRKSEARGGRF